MLDLMERNTVRVSQGYLIGDDKVYLDGCTHRDESAMERFLSTRFGMRRSLLAKHLHIFQQKGAIPK
jgi:hypothetical protein